MASTRQIIRHAVRDALLNKTAAADRVYSTRVLPLRRLELPAIAVYVLDDDVDPVSAKTSPRELKRGLELMLEAWVAAEDIQKIDDIMDDFADQVETVMHADPYFGDVCGDSLLSGTTLEAVETGDRIMGLIQLTYGVTYHTLAPAAPTDLDDFNTVEATHNLGNVVHEDDDAHDEFTVQA